MYPKPTGGFIRVRVGADKNNPAQLLIEHRDDHGPLMNTVTKTVAKK